MHRLLKAFFYDTALFYDTAFMDDANTLLFIYL